MVALTKSPESGSQAGTWAYWRHEARAATHAAIQRLAPLARSQPLDPDKFRGEEKAHIKDLYNQAITAEAVVKLMDEVAALRQEIAELRGARQMEEENDVRRIA